MIASAVAPVLNTSETSFVIAALHTPSAGARLMSMRAPMLSSGSTEMETDLAPAMSASTPAAAAQPMAVITPPPTGSSTSAVDSPTSMSPLEPLLTTSQKALNTSGVA